MFSTSRFQPVARRGQAGGVAVEFALSITIFVALLLALIDFARWLFAYDSIVQATRNAARISVVCNLDSTAFRTRSTKFLLYAEGGTLTRTLRPAACTEDNCEYITVAAVGYTMPSIAPFLPSPLPLPQASTTLVRESMKSASNALCVDPS